MAVPCLLLGGAVFLQGPLEFMVGRLSDDTRDKIMLGLTVLTPVLLCAVIVWAYVQTNRIVGPVDRMIKELDAHLEGTGSGSIALRKQDLLAPLVERINALIARSEKPVRAERS